MEILLTVIGVTVILIGVLGVLNIENAWTLGGEFYIKGNYGRRKNWLERLLDGFEVLRKL